MNQQITTVVAQITAIVWQIIGIAIVLLFASVVIGALGIRQNVIPNIGYLNLAYLCGALWLARGKL